MSCSTSCARPSRHPGTSLAGKALHEHPDWRQRIADGDQPALDAFVQEVRRLYPFAPLLTARAREAQDVLGVAIPRGGVVALDIYGTLHDPEAWPDPDLFDPGRFLDGSADVDTVVPQGGGDVATGDRCPGEGVVLTMMKVAVKTLASLQYEVPPRPPGTT